MADLGKTIKKTVSKVPILGDILFPGEENKDLTAEATQAWKGLETPGQANLSFGEQGPTTPTLDLSAFGGPKINLPTQPAHAGDIMPYETGAPLEGADYGKSAAEGLHSAWGGVPASSRAGKMLGSSGAAGALGPESAFTGAKSAASDITYDPGAEGGLRDAAGYFARLSHGETDPIAEADYQRRNALAEQNRKANTDAALSALEAKGMGSAGGALDARLQGAQASAADRYQAGLDYTAQAAKRRDEAAKTGADVSHTLGTDLEKTAADKAAATDKFNYYKMAGLDDFAAKKASGLDQFEINQAGLVDTHNAHASDVDQATRVANWERGNSVGDTNTKLRNDTNTFNKVTAPQQKFANDVTKTGGVTGALAGQGAAANTATGMAVDNYKAIASGLAGIPSTGGTGGTAGGAPASPSATPAFQWPTAADPNKKPVVDPWA